MKRASLLAAALLAATGCEQLQPELAASAGAVESAIEDGGSIRVPPAAICTLTASPSEVQILPGGYALVSLEARLDGVDSLALAVPLRIVPDPLPPGLVFTVNPNPIAAPGTSILRVDATSTALEGVRTVGIRGPGRTPVRCEALLRVLVKRAPSSCACR